jgi:hypothetical protein
MQIILGIQCQGAPQFRLRLSKPVQASVLNSQIAVRLRIFRI